MNAGLFRFQMEKLQSHKKKKRSGKTMTVTGAAGQKRSLIAISVVIVFSYSIKYICHRMLPSGICDLSLRCDKRM